MKPDGVKHWDDIMSSLYDPRVSNGTKTDAGTHLEDTGSRVELLSPPSVLIGALLASA